MKYKKIGITFLVALAFVMSTVQIPVANAAMSGTNVGWGSQTDYFLKDGIRYEVSNLPTDETPLDINYYEGTQVKQVSRYADNPPVFTDDNLIDEDGISVYDQSTTTYNLISGGGEIYYSPVSGGFSGHYYALTLPNGSGKGEFYGVGKTKSGKNLGLSVEVEGELDPEGVGTNPRIILSNLEAQYPTYKALMIQVTKNTFVTEPLIKVRYIIQDDETGSWSNISLITYLKIFDTDSYRDDNYEKVTVFGENYVVSPPFDVNMATKTADGVDVTEDGYVGVVSNSFSQDANDRMNPNNMTESTFPNGSSMMVMNSDGFDTKISVNSSFGFSSRDIQIQQDLPPDFDNDGVIDEEHDPGDGMEAPNTGAENSYSNTISILAAFTIVVIFVKKLL